jgi:2-polyprenyl-6-methoxyphenol hydroxylase-like FAD-dependent oxidoreductase
MPPSSDRDTEVLIIGAGPTGLVLALWLTHLGVRVRIVDKLPAPETTSRAIGVQARTLEFYRQIRFADTAVQHGRIAAAANLWAAGKSAARLRFADMGADLSPFPYALVLSQDEHEHLLTQRLAGLGIQIERATELEDFEQTDDRVIARLKKSDGNLETCSADFIAGCDGAHSAVRQSLGIGFAGGTYDHLFYVADVDASGPAMNGDFNVALDTSEFLVIFPLKTEGRARLIGTVREDAEHRRENLRWEDVDKRAIDSLRFEIKRVNWFSGFRVHHRVSEHFRQGRAFLLGDAAHIHSPVGGQGMNTGIGDAVNLAWKLAAVLHRRAAPAILDTYEPERIAFAKRLVATTDRVFTGVTSQTALAKFMRLRLVPFFLPWMFKLPPARRFLFRTVSQAVVNYRNSHLSEGRAGKVRGGDRLPWVKPESEGAADNFTPLESIDWQVHVYGQATSELRSACEKRSLPLHVLPWGPNTARAGLRRNAAYLLRPDGYVAVADETASAETIASYLDSHHLAPFAKIRPDAA